ncbi:DUF4065 domain-containing protein [Acidianus sulfidivorans JP7]|uniref:Conjugal transfer protein n=1 Tax=Acidianus sulfidivorans JP7 TaxID=619593 RepID=A0A2U9IPZ7_9CREN|nr:type II toxin-antitoxin system antitoxin SocA domain-containing protein [Acidianus sulfidivorans]AWR98091.1 DUF4065 domain-containing protein [Acidianus sulfidivorans JP7]
MNDKVKKLLLTLLAVAEKENAEVTATKIQKIFFLLEKEKNIDLGLNYQPWLFGPYSEVLDNVLDKLIEERIVEEVTEDVKDPLTEIVVGQKRTYRLMEKKEEFNDVDDEDIVNFFKEWVKKSRREILEYVYKKYKDYTGYSLIREKIIGNQG